MAFGHTLKLLRERMGMTQTKLAELSGVAQTTISILEKRNSKSSRYAVELATALGVTVEQMKNVPIAQLHEYSIGARGSVLPLVAREPTVALHHAATSVTRETLLRLFDELTEPQKATIIEQVRSLVDANRLVLQTFAARDGRGDTGGDHK